MPTSEPPEAASSPSLADRVRSALETIRPAIQSDGGDVELVSVSGDGVVQVRFAGACVGCMAASMTLTYGIERTLKQHVPEVTKVVLA